LIRRIGILQSINRSKVGNAHDSGPDHVHKRSVQLPWKENKSKEKKRSVWKRTRIRSTQSRRQHWIIIRSKYTTAKLALETSGYTSGWMGEVLCLFFDDAQEGMKGGSIALHGWVQL
jgi:hypothetical protein